MINDLEPLALGHLATILTVFTQILFNQTY